MFNEKADKVTWISSFRKTREENKYFDSSGEDRGNNKFLFLARNERKTRLNLAGEQSNHIALDSVSERKKLFFRENNIRFPNRNKLIVFQSIFFLFLPSIYSLRECKQADWRETLELKKFFLPERNKFRFNRTFQAEPACSFVIHSFLRSEMKMWDSHWELRNDTRNDETLVNMKRDFISLVSIRKLRVQHKFENWFLFSKRNKLRQRCSLICRFVYNIS